MPAQLAKLYLLHVERRLASMLNDGGGSPQAVNVSASSLQVLADLVAGRSKGGEHVVCKAWVQLLDQTHCFSICGV